MGFSFHQLCEGGRVRRALVRSERCDKTAPIVVPQVVGVIVGFGQADADLSQRLTKAGEMEGSVSAMTPSKSKIIAVSVAIGSSRYCGCGYGI